MEVLDLTDRDTTEEDIEILSEELLNHRSITDLNLTHARLKAPMRDKLLGFLHGQAVITTLRLSRNVIGYAGMCEVRELLAENGALRHLEIREGVLGGGGSCPIAEALPLSSLQTLDLGSNTLGVPDAEALAASLPQSKITRLILSRNNFGHTGVKSIADCLPETSITALDLSFCGIGHLGLVALSDGLAQNPSVTLLDITGNRIGLVIKKQQTVDMGKEGPAAFGEALAKNSVLKELRLASNELGEGSHFGFNYLAKGLSQNRSVVTIDLQENQLGFKGTQALSDALLENPVVTRLNLANNEIGEIGAVSLCHVLKDDNEIFRRRGFPVDKNLKCNETLTELNLFHNNLGAGSVTALSDIIQTNTFLRVLNLESNKIGALTGELIVDAMKENKTLKELRVKFNQFTNDMEDEIFRMTAANGGKDRKTQIILDNQKDAKPSRSLTKRSAVVATGVQVVTSEGLAPTADEVMRVHSQRASQQVRASQLGAPPGAAAFAEDD
jgi:Ran GTPase-activating protein (RanGAP) involved in mRNA processing and transport